MPSAGRATLGGRPGPAAHAARATRRREGGRTTDRIAIRAEGLAKRYGKKTASAGVSFDVPTGTICAVLGQNAAGRTTAVRILTTLTAPDQGRVIARGDARKLKRRVGGAGLAVRVADPVRVGEAAALLERVTGSEVSMDDDGRAADAPTDAGGVGIARLAGMLEAEDIDVGDLVVRQPTLDEVLLRPTGGAPAIPEVTA